MRPLSLLRFRRAAFAGLLLVYPVGSVGYALVSPSPTCNEVFPASSFALFVFVPGERAETVLRITAIDGEPLDGAVYAHDRPDLFPAARDAKFYLRCQEVDLERPDGCHHCDFALRQLLVGGHESVGYELVSRRYDPLGVPGQEPVVVRTGVVTAAEVTGAEVSGSEEDA